MSEAKQGRTKPQLTGPALVSARIDSEAAVAVTAGALLIQTSVKTERHGRGAERMAERTIYLDPDRRGPQSRRILVRSYRWYATVEVDRDGYVDATTMRGDAPDLPAASTEAVNRARGASIDHIWYEG
ncbi:hypothetical protein [Kitasatospora nipponensis]|uniref:hypothetical protein n=1 Tax=Kitasatospora nipponensis TaxID=258049 RepID=UPI0031DD5E51